ncbi:hypothetical protein A7E78_01205 [Syntrophotalea acetylenivorans]|uniref:Uncharacterized protein n=1 Tax=Syntrophotalea acetylenivorans TaxID=1842532 RepID=A0A1L3GLQ4_9BACT|nr:hypothetical protein A7E78_01205 [Syntrophotalea acetylenivorans]
MIDCVGGLLDLSSAAQILVAIPSAQMIEKNRRPNTLGIIGDRKTCFKTRIDIFPFDEGARLGLDRAVNNCVQKITLMERTTFS